MHMPGAKAKDLSGLLANIELAVSTPLCLMILLLNQDLQQRDREEHSMPLRAAVNSLSNIMKAGNKPCSGHSLICGAGAISKIGARHHLWHLPHTFARLSLAAANCSVSRLLPDVYCNAQYGHDSEQLVVQDFNQIPIGCC